MGGLVGYGAYVPYYRLERTRITGVLGQGGGSGTRSVAAFDEDTTSMAVAAGRAALAGMTGPGGQPGRGCVRQLFFATTVPAYADKTNATAVHAALRLPADALAVDMAGAVRSGVGALVTAAASAVPAMAVLADIRTGLPGSADERDGGDGAAAFVFGGSGSGLPVLAEVIGQGCATAEFLDRWRAPGAAASRVWEERFGELVYGPLAEAAMADALKQAGLVPGQVDHLIVAGLPARAVSRTIRAAGVPAEAVAGNHALPLAGRRAGPGRAGRDGAAGGAGRRRVCPGAAYHRGAGPAPAGAAGGRADRGGQHRAGLRHLPILARVPGPRAAPPPGPGPGGGTAIFAPNELEVRPGRGEMHPLRDAEPAARPGLPAVSRGGRDGPRAARRRARDRDHLHGGPAGLYAEPAHAHGGARLRRRRPDALPAHRRRRGRGPGRPAGRDDLPAAGYRGRRAQLLLESAAGPIRGEGRVNGVTRHQGPGRDRGHGLHRVRRALGQIHRRPADRVGHGRVGVGRRVAG